MPLFSKYTFTLLFFSIACNFSFSQGNTIEVSGTLIEAETKQAVPYATV